MADKDDFTFEEEDSGVGAEQEADDWGEYEPEKKKGSKRLLYMLLLLVVLAGAAAYMFLFAPADGPSPPVNVVKAPRKSIATPMPKAAPVAKSAKVAGSTTTAAAAKPATAKATPSPVPTAVKAPVKPAPPAPVVAKDKSVPAAKPAPVPAEVKPKLFKPKATPATMTAGAYTLSAGAFAMQSSVDGVVKKIRNLGYEPEIKKLKRKVEMTRLLVGVYSPDVAVKKLREVKKITSGAFSLNKGSKTAVYAGSYVVLDKARVFADTTLSKNGIRVTEEPVKIDQTLQRVTFGSCATRTDAVKVSQPAAGKGLAATPAKK